MKKRSIQEVVSLIFKAITLAMGVAVVALSCMGKLDTQSAAVLLGVGLACAGLGMLEGE